MGILQRGLVNKYRVTVPPYLYQAVPVIILGMPPLPIGTQAPLTAINATIPKADKVVTNSISGTGIGGFAMAGQKAKSKGGGQFGRRAGGSHTRKKVSTGKGSGRNGSKGISAQAGKKKSLLRGAGGKFLKRSR